MSTAHSILYLRHSRRLPAKKGTPPLVDTVHRIGSIGVFRRGNNAYIVGTLCAPKDVFDPALNDRLLNLRQAMADVFVYRKDKPNHDTSLVKLWLFNREIQQHMIHFDFEYIIDFLGLPLLRYYPSFDMDAHAKKLEHNINSLCMDLNHGRT